MPTPINSGNTRPAPQALFTTPTFPDNGLLPSSADQVRANIKKRNVLEIHLEDEARAECESQGYVYACRPCSQTLHITLCFDGTNNHERSDNDASPPTTSNIARLYHASLFDTKAVDSTPGYHRYYLQGVGTEFKQIHEPGPSSLGLMGAKGGENRINWGITRLLDALQHCVHLVAAREQRGCFPVDSIRRKATPDDPNCPSTYRVGTYEYLYPGVHSDVGGYPPGEQGKALEGGEYVLSQIALNHMYEAAFKAGCPGLADPIQPGNVL